MPTYEYHCDKCEHDWELEQRIVDSPVTRCPHCESQSAKRLISSKTGFSLKGPGWYADGYSSVTGKAKLE